jgi:deazaflavin-dependent oxidoreductase (nitroreductase family)
MPLLRARPSDALSPYQLGPNRPCLRGIGVDKHRTMSNDTMTPLKNAVRVFNKHVLNPAMMTVAGRKHWYAAVIRHTGRRSGKSYATPVVADRVADGFILPLPYGTGVDWLRNVLAAGRATVTVGGETFDVTEPEIIHATTAAPQLSPRRRHAFQRLGIDNFVKVTMVK